MGGEFLEQLLRCFDDSFVRSAGRLVALANVDHEDGVPVGAATALNSKRIESIADVFRADMVSPLGATVALRNLLRVQDAASLRVEAWAVLQAMDRALGAAWFSKFRSEGPINLEEGSLFPVGQLQLKTLLKKYLVDGTQLSPRARSLNPASRFLENLGRWNGRGVSVRLEFHREVIGCDRVAFCLPNAAVTPASFKIERHDTASGDPGFYALRPADEDTQWSTIERMLDRAREDEAQLVLFPELSMTEVLQRRVREWRNTTSFEGAVLAGSAHLASEVTNRASLTLGEYDHHHHKMNPYVLQAKSAFFDTEEFARTEVVSDRRELVLRFFGSCSVAVLVCKDFLDQELLATLALLRPSLVLVAALSDTTTVFGDAAAQLRLAGQSISLVANAPIGRVPAALAFLPLRNEAGKTSGDQRFTRAPDGYQFFNLGTT